MSAVDLGYEPIKTNRAWKPEDKRYRFPSRTEIQRYFTVWSWQEGPITNGGGPKEKYFWEKLHSDAPASASPYCCLLNTVIFYRSESDHTELCREDTYGFSCGSTILTNPIANEGEPIFYQVASGRVVYLYEHWWMRWNAYCNTRIARMLNAGWPHQ